MVGQLGDVGDLNSWEVVCIRLAPIPRASTAGPKFHILPCPEAIDFHDSPRQLLNSWRFRMFDHAATSFR